jgi:hypothetical protein
MDNCVNEENIKILENKVNSLQYKISKLEEIINLNIKKKYLDNNFYNFNDTDLTTITSKEIEIPQLKRMNAFNFSDTKYLNNSTSNNLPALLLF